MIKDYANSMIYRKHFSQHMPSHLFLDIMRQNGLQQMSDAD